MSRLPSTRRLLALAFLATAPLTAQPRRDRLGLEQYLEWEDVQSPRLSPDGRQVIYTRRWVDKLNDRWESSLWIMGSDGSRNRFLVNGAAAAWSPDGQRIAYVARGEPGGLQVFVRWMDAEGAVTQVTRVTEAPAELEWSPDGRSIAFRMKVPYRDGWSVPIPPAPKGAKWVEAPRVVTKLDYRQDREGFTDDAYQHVFVVPADGGTPRQVTSGDWDHAAPRWMPDGKTIVFSANRVPEAEHAWRQSDIYAVDVASGAIRALTTRSGPDGQPAPSPDGKLVAYTGYDHTDDTWRDQQLYVMNADGTGARSLTASLDRSPSGLIWAPDASGVYFTAENEGARHLYFASLTGQVRQVTKGAMVLSVSDISRTGLAIGTASTARAPTDVVAFPLLAPEPRALTAVNEDVLAGVRLGETEEVWYRSADGLRIQGWIVKPPDFDPTKRYPLLLEIHGGPHSMYNVGFSFARQEHVAQGYVLLYTNPRGSTGYGSAFGNAIKNAYPGKDYDDLMAGVDTVLGRGYVDPKRLYVFGCSGGGVLTAWIVGHTNRFAGAASMCPVTNWMSFVGTTDSPGWYRNFERPFWEDPAEYLRRSPIMYAGNVTTPTLLMTGVLDLRTPMPQTEEFYMALRYRKVPTAMVRFNNEWHGTSSTPSNFLRTQAYLRDWFARWPAPPAAQ